MKYIIFGIVSYCLFSCSSESSTPVQQKNHHPSTKKDTLILESTNSEEILNPAYQKYVTAFKQAVVSKDKSRIAGHFSFPFQRPYPNATIKNESELVDRYYEIFDQSLIYEILQSDPASDWSEVGWRGIMLNAGTLWMSIDGKIVGSNHETTLEKQKIAALIATDKNEIHPSLRAFLQSVMVFETPRFLIRIDELKNGSYRYASWSKGRSMKEKPDLILTGGSVEYSGSGGNHQYVFKNAAFTYTCDRIIMGEAESPPIRLILEKNGQQLFEEVGELRD